MSITLCFSLLRFVIILVIILILCNQKYVLWNELPVLLYWRIIPVTYTVAIS